MDRSLDETIAERQRSSNRGRRPPPRRNNYPRDGVRKSTRDDRTNLDNDWVHDRFDDEDRDARPSYRGNRSRRDDIHDRDEEPEESPLPAKLRVDNLHYDLTEDDLHDLFTRIGTVTSVSLRYDRAGRSEGTAYVVYTNASDAKAAIREFDGANAKGQPIRLAMMPSGPSGGKSAAASRRDNPFDRVENPRSLFDRVEAPKGRRARSASPLEDYEEGDRRRGVGRRGAAPTGRERRSDVSKPAPENIDRYVPGESSGRSPRRERGRDNGRRPGERRERGGGRGGRDRGDNGERMVNGRPRKTQEELDAEMEDYWGKAAANNDAGGAPPAAGSTAQAEVPAIIADDDIDMIT